MPTALCRSICRRLRLMNERHSGSVIVSKFSEKRSTLADDITTSIMCGFRKCVLASLIMPKRVASAKQIMNECESRRGRDCGISGRRSSQACNFYCRYTGLNSPTRCRKLPLGEFPFELCKGDLSITILFATGCGVDVLPENSAS